MTTAMALLALLIVVFGALVVAICEAVWLAAQVRTERGRVTDLHNRLSSRTLAEYAQWSPTAPPRPEPDEIEWVFDQTGLIAAEAGDDGEA